MYYLARQHFNSKTIIWQPCELVAEDDSHYHIKFLFNDGQINIIKKTKSSLVKQNGKYAFVDKPTLKPLTKSWLKKEAAKNLIAMNAAKAKYDLLNELTEKVAV